MFFFCSQDLLTNFS